MIGEREGEMKNGFSALLPSSAGGSTKKKGLDGQLGASGAAVSARYNSSLNPDPQQRAGRFAARAACLLAWRYES